MSRLRTFHRRGAFTFLARSFYDGAPGSCGPARPRLRDERRLRLAVYRSDEELDVAKHLRERVAILDAVADNADHRSDDAQRLLDRQRRALACEPPRLGRREPRA